MNQDKSVEALNNILRGEISAVETYDQALEKLDDDASIAEQLRQCRVSHQERVSLLRGEITRRGGQPAGGSGPWGAFAKLVEGSAKALGKKAAISVLEEGEDHGLKMYRDDLPKLDEATRSTLAPRLMNEQQQTHRAMSTLKHTLH
jgi:rubrerythrin